MASYLITGSSRGIGLALVTALASKPASDVSKVYASARSETDSLKKLATASDGRVVFVQLDVTSQESINNATVKIASMQGGKGLDVLINNAGIMDPRIEFIEQLEGLDEVLEINVVGVHNVTKAFLPELKKGAQKKIIMISSTLGSIGLASAGTPFPVPAYKVSKAALNMLTVQYALFLENDGFTVITLSPGWIRTDLGSSAADLSPEQGAQATLDIVSRATPQESGKFFNVRVPGWENAPGLKRYDGACPPW